MAQNDALNCLTVSEHLNAQLKEAATVHGAALHTALAKLAPELAGQVSAAVGSAPAARQ